MYIEDGNITQMTLLHITFSINKIQYANSTEILQLDYLKLDLLQISAC